DDPAGDLVEACMVVFRRFVLAHPALFTIGFLRAGVPPDIYRQFCTAQENSLARMYARIGRLRNVGLLGQRSEPQAGMELSALCEGLAAFERRGFLRSNDAERVWRDALRALVAGWGATGEATDCQIGVEHTRATWTACPGAATADSGRFHPPDDRIGCQRTASSHFPLKLGRPPLASFGEGAEWRHSALPVTRRTRCLPLRGVFHLARVVKRLPDAQGVTNVALVFERRAGELARPAVGARAEQDDVVMP